MTTPITNEDQTSESSVQPIKRKVIIALGDESTSAGVQRKQKAVKTASNTQVGVMQGLQRDIESSFTTLEETIDAMGITVDDIEGSIADATYTAAGAKTATPLMKDFIKELKAANSAVAKAQKALDKVAAAIIKAVHPDSVDTGPADDEEDIHTGDGVKRVKKIPK